MKIIALIIIFCSVFCSAGFAEEDFGLRVCLGADETESISNYELGVHMDFLVFQNLFMQMGGTFLLPPSGSVEIAINSLGLEYNIPVGKNKMFLGTVVNRSYIKGTNGGGFKAFSFHLGYKLKWFSGVDVVVFGGIIPEALLIKNPSQASGNGYFLRTALEWYY